MPLFSKSMMIAKFRIARKMTQLELAQKIGISRTTLIQIEKGLRSLTLPEVQKCAEIFGVTLQNFIDGTDEPLYEVLIDTSNPIYESDDIRISIPQNRIDKFKEVLLYILEQIGARHNVGEAVISKLLYFIDFDYYEKYEEQLIGAEYIKNHHGPTPILFPKIVTEMIENHEVTCVPSRYFEYVQKKYFPLRKSNLSFFSAQEKSHIDWEIERFGYKSAREMELISHRDTPWIIAQSQKIIPYESVFYRSDEFSVREYDEL